MSREAVLSQVDIDTSHGNIDISLSFGSLYLSIYERWQLAQSPTNLTIEHFQQQNIAKWSRVVYQ